MRRITKTADFIKSRLHEVPKTAIILGSGLGQIISKFQAKEELLYEDIPNFPISTVVGHEGKLVCGVFADKPIVAMMGRFHYYEGHDVSNIIFPIRVFKMLGIENIIVTNAAGGINRSFNPGDLMVISDHISFFAPSPLRGANYNKLGPRFPDMSEAYSKELINLAKGAAKSVNIDIKEGVYAFTKGPMYETPAEIRALSFMGADAVGMSTVPEVIAARHLGINVLGISCITNMASGILEKSLSHLEVIETAKSVEGKFSALIEKIIERW